MNCTANPRPIPILVYHQIEQAPPKGAPFRSLCVSPGAFARQMRMLKLLGYQGLSMSGLQPYLAGERQGKVVGITFDDGYLNNLQHALPVLERLGFSSTCYAVSALVGQSNVWDHAAGVAPAPLMDATHLRQWADQGQEIGAHTRQHLHLPALDDALAKVEIQASKTELEALLGRPVTHFCYPYGEFKPRHADWVRECGYTSATTTERSRCLQGMNPWQLPRVPVMRSTTALQFWLKLQTSYEDQKSGQATPH